MQIQGRAMAGTLESNDVMVTVSPADALEVQVTSIVLGQFGEELRRVALDTAAQLGVQGALIELDDRGAVECTVRARVETALTRAKEAKA
jgi:citrate lyase subunit gamma (acyl carrier protein)